MESVFGTRLRVSGQFLFSNTCQFKLYLVLFLLVLVQVCRQQKVLNERCRVQQVPVGIQCGEETHVPVLVHPQFRQSLLELIRVCTAWILEVR